MPFSGNMKKRNTSFILTALLVSIKYISHSANFKLGDIYYVSVYHMLKNIGAIYFIHYLYKITVYQTLNAVKNGI